MANSASSNIEDFADLISGHGDDTPVNDNLVSILRSLASMTDSELAAAKITTKATVWNSLEHDYNDAFYLPKGRFYADIGFKVEQSVSLETLNKVIDDLKQKRIAITARTQAAILVNAQQAGLLQDWGKLGMLG